MHNLVSTTAAILGSDDPDQQKRDLTDLAEAGEAIAWYATMLKTGTWTVHSRRTPDP